MKPIKNIDTLDKRQKKYLKKKFGISSWKELAPTILKDLKEAMKELTDTRQQVKIKYKIWDIVTVVVISCLCGMKTWEEIHDFVVMKYGFFRKFWENDLSDVKLWISKGCPDGRDWLKEYSWL